MAGEFKTNPLVTLDKGETLALLKSGAPIPEFFQMDSSMDIYRVKSQWLCDLLNEREKTTGYQYNAEFQRWFEKEYGFEPSKENGSVLSVLVYNAQCYRRSDKLTGDGWQPGTQALLEQAFAENRRIELMGHNILCQAITDFLKVRKIEGKLYAMRPRKRKFAVNIIGEPARLEGSGPVFNERSGIQVITTFKETARNPQSGIADPGLVKAIAFVFIVTLAIVAGVCVGYSAGYMDAKSDPCILKGTR